MARPLVDRGIVTVAVVDVERSTRRGADGVGPASTEAIRDPRSLAREHLDGYGGREAASPDGSLRAVFSSPRRAVSWAAACRRALGADSTGVRIGVHAGEAAAGDGDPSGPTADGGARIAARAAGGEVLVTDVVRQLVGSGLPGVSFVDRGRVPGLGADERWRVWAVEDGTRPRPTGTVGRAHEIDVLTGIVAGASAGTGSSLLLEGEAGIGKTHLASVLRQRARAAGILVVDTAADEVTSRTGDLAWSIAEHPELAARSRTRLRAVLDTDDQLPVDRSYAVVEATLAALESLASDAPVVVIVEDAHWADDLSLAVLRAMLRQLPPSGISIVVTMRPAPRPPMLDRVVDLAAELGTARMVLTMLDAVDVHGLAASVLGAAPGPTLRELLATTSGNPLFVSELLRSLDDEGLVHLEAGIADVERTVVPSSFNATLARRLSWLSAEALELLRWASLLGTGFTLASLAAIGGRPVIEVAADLRDASQAGLLVGDGEHLRFRHDLVRDAVYASMSEAERRDLHRAAGHALARSGFPAEIVAGQFARGATRGDLEAVRWLRRAGGQVMSVSPSTASDLFETALALAPDGWEGLTQLQALMLEPLAWCGRFGRAEQLASVALASSLDPAVRFDVLRGLAAIDGNRGRIPQAIDHLTAAASVPGAPVDEAERLVCARAQLQALTGAIGAEVAIAAGEATLASGRRKGDATTQCVAHQVIGVAGALLGWGDRALEAMDESVRLLDSGHVRPSSYLIADATRAGTLLYLDRIDDALLAAERARERHERSGTLTQLPLLAMITAAAHHDAGRWDDCLAAVEAGQEVALEIESLNFTLYFAALGARIAWARGDEAAARQRLAEGMERLADGVLFGADWLLDTQVEVLARDDPAAALALAELTWGQTSAIRHFYGSRARAVATVRLAVAEGRLDLAEVVAASAAEGAARSPVVTARAAALQCRGLIDGDPAPLLEAVDLLRPGPFGPALAGACEDAGVVLLACGRRADAASHLGEAAGILDDLGAGGALGRVRSHQAAAGVKLGRARTPRPTFGWDALTPTELVVSGLVAEGLTNPDIGERLHISRRTVETHLAHVFRKLGIATRAQLAAEVVRRSAEDP